MNFLKTYILYLYVFSLKPVVTVFIFFIVYNLIMKYVFHRVLISNAYYWYISLFVLIYIPIIILLCIIHRLTCIKFKVYLSFSTYRSSYWANFISNILWPVLWYYNIDYYDFRKNKRYHELDSYAICREIDLNLSDSQIFLRFYDGGVAPKPTLTANQWMNTIYNPFTSDFSDRHPDYYKYEVDMSYDEFGFVNKYNRFQVCSPEVYTGTITKIKTLMPLYNESMFSFAIKIVNELINGNNQSLYWRNR